jgi:hypothetical protein
VNVPVDPGFASVTVPPFAIELLNSVRSSFVARPTNRMDICEPTGLVDVPRAAV